MLFSLSQDDGSGTDFLKNAITYGQTEGLGSDLWRVDDVSVVFFHCAVTTSGLTQFSSCELILLWYSNHYILHSKCANGDIQHQSKV